MHQPQVGGTNVVFSLSLSLSLSLPLSVSAHQAVWCASKGPDLALNPAFFPVGCPIRKLSLDLRAGLLARNLRKRVVVLDQLQEQFLSPQTPQVRGDCNFNIPSAWPVLLMTWAGSTYKPLLLVTAGDTYKRISWPSNAQPSLCTITTGPQQATPLSLYVLHVFHKRSDVCTHKHTHTHTQRGRME